MPLPKVEGRAVHYHIGDSNGEVRPGKEAQHLTFNGTSLEELLERLKEETGLDDVIMCSRSPINGKLLPLRLQLPPNNAAVHIVLVQESSKGTVRFNFFSSSIRVLSCLNRINFRIPVAVVHKNRAQPGSKQ